MEKEERRQEVAPLSFPNFGLTVPYAGALYYVPRHCSTQLNAPESD